MPAPVQMEGYVYDVRQSNIRRHWWCGHLVHGDTNQTLVIADGGTKDEVIAELNKRYKALYVEGPADG